jgi:hypothetical protein
MLALLLIPGRSSPGRPDAVHGATTARRQNDDVVSWH